MSQVANLMDAPLALDMMVTHSAATGINPFVFLVSIFVLAIFVGYYVVWQVTPALHTPLMAVTNAISSVIVVGALLAVGAEAAGFASSLFGFIALVLASVNIFGGFLVTHRMLAMYKKKRSEAGFMSVNFAAFLYLVSGVLFIMALRGLSHPSSSRQGNTYGMVGMAIAIITTLFLAGPSFGGWFLILLGLAIGGGAGAYIARTIPMTSMPQLVAAFHSLVGLAAVMVAAAALYSPEAFGIAEADGIPGQALLEMALGVAIGAITFTGSIIAFLKLDGRMSGSPIMLPSRHLIISLAAGLIVFIFIFMTTQSVAAFWIIVLISFALGVLLIVPIGGADMPVVVSMLNSYSGWAAAGIGFTLGNLALIITGALVGSSGAILSYIMCKGMNRSFISVILGGFGGDSAVVASGDLAPKPVKLGSAEDAAFLMANASKVIIVPGYGMAVSQAQHALREMTDVLKKAGVEVKYAIHPVAGRMPGHMNVLLAEANVPYDDVFELEDINSEFAQADVAYVIGANDVTNPSARDDKTSPIYGMPILDVDKAKTCLFVKRSLASGYAGIDNSLFYKDGTMMLLGDAKKMTEEIVKALNH